MESKYSYSGKAGNHKRHLVFLGAVVLFLVMNIMPSCKNNTSVKNQDQSKIDSIATVKDTLQSQYNSARMQIDNDATKTAQLDSLIKQKDREIEKIKNTVAHLEKNNRKMASELKTDKKLIASLKSDLNDQSKSFEERLSSLEKDKDDLVRQRDSLMAKYDKILALGSVLHASNIRLTAVHLKHHGTKEKNTKRARKTDELKVDFDIDENRIAENGTKKLYLAINDPSGTLLNSATEGSGFTTSSNGSKLNYSVMKEIPLITNQPVKDISVTWHQDGDYKKGAYTIAIYNGGFKIGGGTVDLK